MQEPVPLREDNRKTIPQIREKLSWVPVKLGLHANGNEIGCATGFFYAHNKRTFLVTNWHVVTGINPNTSTVLHSGGAVPDTLALCVSGTKTTANGGQGVRWTWRNLSLLDSDNKPIWTEHPTYGRKVDIVAIPLSGLDETAIRPANAQDLDLEKLRLYPSMATFVLGFPRGMSGGGHFPIWKRATIATEPELDIDGLPRLYIDTATREGMSGAPVYAQEVGYWLPDGTTDPDQGSFGKGMSFIGIYSGRIGAEDEFKAQLGIVWKESALLTTVAAVPPKVA